MANLKISQLPATTNPNDLEVAGAVSNQNFKISLGSAIEGKLVGVYVPVSDKDLDGGVVGRGPTGNASIPGSFDAAVLAESGLSLVLKYAGINGDPLQHFATSQLEAGQVRSGNYADPSGVVRIATGDNNTEINAAIGGQIIFDPNPSIPVDVRGALDTVELRIGGTNVLDGNGKINPVFQNANTIIDITPNVADEAAMLAITPNDNSAMLALRTDVNINYFLNSNDDPTVVGNWIPLLSPTDLVTSVDGRVGNVNLEDKYQQLSEKNQSNGYLGINADGSTDVNSSEFEILKLIRGSAGGAAIDFRNSSGRIGRAGFQSSGEFELLGDIKNSLLMRGPENEEGYFRLIEGSSFQGFGIHYLGNSTNQTDFFTHQLNDSNPLNDTVFMSVQRGSKNVEFRGEVSAETFKSQSFNTIPFTSSAGSQNIILPATPGAIYRLTATYDVTGDASGQGGYSMDVVLGKTTNRTLGIMNESSVITGLVGFSFNNLNENTHLGEQNASPDAYRTVVISWSWSAGSSGNIDINIMRVI